MDGTINEVERDIDRIFAASPLKHVGYAQAVWTLLSVTEDHFLKVTHQSSSESNMHIFADVHLNALTYPLRVCHKESPPGAQKLQDVLIDDHYKLAWDWLNLADHGYYNFSSIFPLWHRGQIQVAVAGRTLNASHTDNQEKTYEVYNRLIRKDAKPESLAQLSSADVAALALPNISHGADWFRVNFNPALVARLVSMMSPVVAPRHSLPETWAFDGFTLGDYKKVFLTIQAMMWAWVVVRNGLAANGMPGLGYRSAVWVVPHSELATRLRRYTGIDSRTVETVLRLITFGSSGIRNPDIATQPLVDLRNKTFALSPFVWLSTNAERNLCTLLNQIPEQKQIYSRLKNEKEVLLRDEICEFLDSLGLEKRSGVVEGTDLDLAIIDRHGKACLCLELKWFIEPAEIREIDERTQELQSGIKQAKKIEALYMQGDTRLTSEILAIDGDYTFSVAVASQNWIGHTSAQDKDVPIVKVWHLLHKIKDCGSLRSAMEWLTQKEYLPVEGKDFEIVPVRVNCGPWSCNWYGIKPLAQEEGPARR